MKDDIEYVGYKSREKMKLFNGSKIVKVGFHVYTQPPLTHLQNCYNCQGVR